MNKKDVILSENDLISICKRLDLNKDGKIDLCELHAFFGYPDCSICCLSSPCTSCGIKDCNICFKDSVCYFHNRIHDDIFSKYIKENENIKENKKNKCTCDEIYMIKFILIMFLVGMLILFGILIINWSRKD